MPFTSKAQQKLFFAKEARGELPKGTAIEWAHATKNLKNLPEHSSSKKSKHPKGGRTLSLKDTGVC